MIKRCWIVTLYGIFFLVLGGCNRKKLAPEGELKIECHVSHYEGGAARISVYLKNQGEEALAVATKPFDSRLLPSKLENRDEERVILMYQIIPPASSVENEVYSDEGLGRVVLNSGEVFKLYDYDIMSDDRLDWRYELSYIAFPEKSYRDYWSGDVEMVIAEGVGPE